MPDRRVETTGAADRAADEASRAAAAHEPRMAPADLYHLSDAVREAARNALEHSGDRRVIVKLEASGSEITLTVSDRGHGIPQALRRNSSLTAQDKDHILLQMAANPAVTSTGNPERGHGLHRLAEAASRNGDRLQLRSGRAQLCVEPGGQPKGKLVARHRSGTLLTLTIALPGEPGTTSRD